VGSWLFSLPGAFCFRKKDNKSLHQVSLKDLPFKEKESSERNLKAEVKDRGRLSTNQGLFKSTRKKQQKHINQRDDA